MPEYGGDSRDGMHETLAVFPGSAGYGIKRGAGVHSVSSCNVFVVETVRVSQTPHLFHGLYGELNVMGETGMLRLSKWLNVIWIHARFHLAAVMKLFCIGKGTIPSFVHGPMSRGVFTANAHRAVPPDYAPLPNPAWSIVASVLFDVIGRRDTAFVPVGVPHGVAFPPKLRLVRSCGYASVKATTAMATSVRDIRYRCPPRAVLVWGNWYTRQTGLLIGWSRLRCSRTRRLLRCPDYTKHPIETPKNSIERTGNE